MVAQIGDDDPPGLARFAGTALIVEHFDDQGFVHCMIGLRIRALDGEVADFLARITVVHRKPPLLRNAHAQLGRKLLADRPDALEARQDFAPGCHSRHHRGEVAGVDDEAVWRELRQLRDLHVEIGRDIHGEHRPGFHEVRKRRAPILVKSGTLDQCADRRQPDPKIGLGPAIVTHCHRQPVELVQRRFPYDHGHPCRPGGADLCGRAVTGRKRIIGLRTELRLSFAARERGERGKGARVREGACRQTGGRQPITKRRQAGFEPACQRRQLTALAAFDFGA